LPTVTAQQLNCLPSSPKEEFSIHGLDRYNVHGWHDPL
jgi:hypothetical protein